MKGFILILACGALTPLATTQTFVDVTDAAGVAAPYQAMFSAKYVARTWMQNWMAGAVAVGDYDNDGWHDMLVVSGDLKNLHLFHNDQDGTFTDVALAAGLTQKAKYSQPLFMDYNSDGALDILLLTYGNYIGEEPEEELRDGPSGASGDDGTSGVSGPGGGKSPDNQGPGVIDTGLIGSYRNYVYRNNGDGTFTDVTLSTGLKECGRTAASFGDIDGDGLLDLSTGSWVFDNMKVFKNMGGGQFEERTPDYMAETFQQGFHQHIVDYDRDGDYDLLTVNDFGGSRIWENLGDWEFADHPFGDPVGVGLDRNGMGSCILDYDNDGDLDWYVTAIYADGTGTLPPKPGNFLYSNNDDGTFADVTIPAGVDDGGWGWAAMQCDLDNDGRTDMVHANGWANPDYEADLLRVFMNNGDGTFTESAAAMGLVDPDQGRGLAVFDYDQDGDQDIAVNNRDTGFTLWQNQGAPGNWLAINLRGVVNNNRGVGAIIKLRKHPEANGSMPRQMRQVECTSNFMSQSPMTTWFGLNTCDRVMVTVEWPNGQVDSFDVTANQRITLMEQ